MTSLARGTVKRLDGRKEDADKIPCPVYKESFLPAGIPAGMQTTD